VLKAYLKPALYTNCYFFGTGYTGSRFESSITFNTQTWAFAHEYTHLLFFLLSILADAKQVCITAVSEADNQRKLDKPVTGLDYLIYL